MHYSMKAVRSVAFCLVMIGAAIPAVAQETPKAEVSGGYQFLRFSSEGEEGENVPGGWYADVAYNWNEVIGIVGEVGGNYKSTSEVDITVDENIHEFMGGVRVSSRRNPKAVPFGQFLVGGARYSAKRSGTGFSETFSETDFALQVGGGVNVRLTDRVGARVGADYLRVFGEDSDTNVFRFVAGIVLPF